MTGMGWKERCERWFANRGHRRIADVFARWDGVR